MLLPFHNQAIDIGRKFLSGVRLGGHFSKPEALLSGGWTSRAATPGRRSLRGVKMNILNEKVWFLALNKF